VASTACLLGRGMTRHCARCGGGHLFRGWFRMADRCPGCDYRFAREDGFFLGAFVINFGITTLSLAVVMGVLIAVLASGGGHLAIVLVAAAAAVVVVAVPIIFYPLSKTLWTAIDLAMHRGESWAALPKGGTPVSRD
jgi:uncharacterized protein (DUF983 family)